VADAGAGERRVLDEGDLIGQLREQPDRATEDLVEIRRVAEEGLDGLSLSGGERPEVGQLVDEETVALVGGHATRRRVRSGDQLLLFEEGHVVADGRGRDAELVALDDGLRADGLARGDVVVHDDTEDFESALRDHDAPLSSLGP
jgi:hypothetical protein